MGNIVWLVSYPKSGNTWFRAFLAALLDENQESPDINRLAGGPIFSSRYVFNNYTGLDSSDLLPDEIDKLRPAVYRKLSSEAATTVFIKAHDAYTYLSDGNPLFPTEATRCALYLVRNPLDIAPSFANHSTSSLDKTISSMCDAKDAFCGNPKNLHNQLRQWLLGWSGHIKSWLSAEAIPVRFIRYEDMKAKPLETFINAIQFAGLTHSLDAVANALDACAFEKLRQQEAENGFREKGLRVNAFFRKGEVGSWRETLEDRHVDQLIKTHADIMHRFGYLDGAENPVY